MVSFSCARCGDVVKKPKVQSHAQQCGTASYSCVDCMTVFDLHTVNNHSSCMSEVQKYQGKWKPDFSKPAAKDSDDEDEAKNTKAHTMQRNARPKLSFTDSDDSDDEKAKKPAAKKAAAPAAKAPASVKRTAKDSDSDSDEEKKKPAPKKVAAPAPVPKAALKRTRDSDSDSDEDEKKKPAAKQPPRTASPAIAAKASSSSKLERISLPPSNVAAPKKAVASDKEYAIANETIPLGTHELIGEIVDEIIAEQKALNGNSKPTAAVVGQELVLRYRKRLGKAMAKAIAPILEERGL